MPDNEDKVSNEPSEQFEGPSELLESVNKVKDLLKFWKTRAAVLAEEPLFDYDKNRLERSGYLGAWHFNLLQSSISGIPGFLIPIFARWLHLAGSDESADDSISEAIQSFAIPFVLMLTAYLVGRASLWKVDSTKAARQRAARIFLYLDGAYGFLPQLAASAAFALFLLAPEAPPLRSVIFWIGIWQLIVYMRTIPEQLFHEVGYTDRILSPYTTISLFPAEPEGSRKNVMSRSTPPLWKFRICVLVVVPIVSLIVLGVLLALSMFVHFMIQHYL
jgi:hypothetical protein